MHAHTGRRPCRAAFTLIELLVVIAIIAILASLLFPVFMSARERGRQAVCLSNMKQIVTAILMYAQDYDESMPPSDPNVPPINGGAQNGEPFDRLLTSYVKNDQVYVCPSDGAPRPGDGDVWDGNYAAKNAPRSYSIADTLTTQQATNQGVDPDPNTGLNANALADFQQPADTVALAENWAINEEGMFADNVQASLAGNTLLGCDTWKLAGRVRGSSAPIDNFTPCASDYNDPTEIPTPGHFNQGSYAFVDGHVKSLHWVQVRTNDFWIFKLQKPKQTFSP